MANVGNWIIENTITAGAGQITLDGSDVGYTTFRNAGITGEVWYSIIDGGNREAGIGTFNGVNKLTRSDIRVTLVNGVYSDNNPSPIVLSGNTATVACTYNASAYEELFNHLSDAANPHNVVASQVAYDPTGDNVTSATDLQAATRAQSIAIEKSVSSMSGLVSGGRLLGEPYGFGITAGSGVIFNSYSDPSNTTTIDVSWPDIGGTPLQTGGLTVGTTRVFITATGEVLQVPGAVSQSTFRTNIFLGIVNFTDAGVRAVTEAPAIVKQTATDLYDDLTVNIQTTGLQILPVDNELQIWNHDGTIFYPGINWHNDPTNPNTAYVPALGDSTTPATFTPLFMDGSLGAPTTDIPLYANTTGTALDPLNGDNATIHRLYGLGVESNRLLILLYGQFEYNNANVAKDNLIIEDDLINFPEETESLNFLGYVCVEGNAVDFTDSTDAWIVSGGPTGSSSSSQAPATTDHTALSNRSAANQHPIEAIGTQDGEQLRDTLDGKVVWKNLWVQGEYQKNDMVRDGSYTAIANTLTSERPALQPIGNSEHIFDGAFTPQTVSTNQIIFGARYTAGTLVQLSAYRVYLQAGFTYEIYTVTSPLTAPVFTLEITVTAPSTGWFEANISPTLVMAGTTFDIVVLLAEQDPTTADYTANWNYTTPNNENSPGAGVASQANRALSLLKFNKTDDDGGDATTELAALSAGDTVSTADTKWTVQSTADAGNVVSYTVVPAIQDPTDGVKAFTLETVVPTDLIYDVDVGYYAALPAVSGLLAIGVGYESISVTDDAYGVDVVAQEYSGSDEWDIVAVSNGTISGGGTSSHPALTGLDVADQHPIAAVAGLQAALDALAASTGTPVKAIGNINNTLLYLPLTSELGELQAEPGSESQYKMDLSDGTVVYSCSTARTYVNVEGIVKTAAIGKPRFEKEGLLMEGAATNLIAYSTFNTGWSASSSDIYNGQSSDSPDRTTIYRLWIVNNGQPGLLYTDYNSASVETVTVSCWMRAQPNQTSTVRLALDIVGYNIVGDDIVVDDKWRRYSATFQSTVGFVYPGIINGTGATAIEIDVWGFQMEEGEHATSYIPTNGAAVTVEPTILRLRRGRNTKGLNPLNDETLLLDYNIISVPQDAYLFSIYAYEEEYRAYISSATNEITIQYGDGVVTIPYQQSGRLGMSISGLTATRYLDGVPIPGGVTVSTDPRLINETFDLDIMLGCNSAAETSFLYGHVTNFRIIGRALTEEEMKIA